MSFGANMAVCMRCLLNSDSTCTVTGRDVAHHAKREECPHPSGSLFAMRESERMIHLRVVAQPSTAPGPWPLAARVLKNMARPEDRGVGDTVARLIDPMGGALFKRWFKRIAGFDCGCEDRRDRLNSLYPYG